MWRTTAFYLLYIFIDDLSNASTKSQLVLFADDTNLFINAKDPGPRFNIKMTSYQYRKSHCGDKTILPPSYLHNGISYTGKTTSLY